MRFLVDECAGPAVARTLRELGHDVYSVFEQARGVSDVEVLRAAATEKRNIVTIDKDFGEGVYRDGAVHSGIVPLRLRDQSAAAKSAAVAKLLDSYSHRIEGAFVTVTPRQVRFAKLRGVS